MLMLVAAVVAILAPGATATAAARGTARMERVVKADVVSRGLKSTDKVVIVGDSFQAMSSQRVGGAHSIDKVLATGTLDRATGKVTSFNPIILE